MGPSKRKALNKENEAGALIDQAENIKAGIKAKAGHPFRVIKRQFGCIKVRDKG
jgi:IS5 family transposase